MCRPPRHKDLAEEGESALESASESDLSPSPRPHHPLRTRKGRKGTKTPPKAWPKISSSPAASLDFRLRRASNQQMPPMRTRPVSRDAQTRSAAFLEVVICASIVFVSGCV